jgi:hypothetical protein
MMMLTVTFITSYICLKMGYILFEKKIMQQRTLQFKRQSNKVLSGVREDDLTKD